MKIAIFTLGCKVNQADSHSLQELFVQAGFEIVEADAPADVYIINTCVVTNVGQQKSRQVIRRFIKNNPKALVVVTGCYPQTANEEVESIEGVGLIVGNQNRAEIVSLVEGALADRKPLNTVRSISNAVVFEDIPSGKHADKTRAFLKIQEGCNQFCTYCIIPYARGRLRSRSLESIREEVGSLTAQGFREVVLLGIHLGAFGKEVADDVDLAAAVRVALSVHELQRLRLGSLECIEIGESLLELMATEERLAKHLHLPLQSGCNPILRAMNRPYTTEEFAELVADIRRIIPDIAITTDIIVGFPGETTEMFEETLEFARRMKFAKIHIFPFSKRKGTPAESMKGQVSKLEKQARANRLGTLDEHLHQEFLQSCIGKPQVVLFEQQKDGLYSGYTSNYARVYMNSTVDICNSFCTVYPTELYQDGLKAEIKQEG